MELLSTLGPSSLNKTVLKKLELLGVSLFRINLSHTEIKDLEETIDLIRSYTNVPICIDTEGAQIRTRLKKKANLEEGEIINIFFDYEKNPNFVNFYPKVSIYAVEQPSSRGTRARSGSKVLLFQGPTFFFWIVGSERN